MSSVLSSTESPVRERPAPKRETEQLGISTYLFGAVLLFAAVTLPALLRVLAFVRMS